MREVCVDRLARKRCWNCGGQAFTPLPSLADRLSHHEPSLLHQPNLECTRCGAHCAVGRATRFDGPSDPAYADEWAREQAAPAQASDDVVDPEPAPPEPDNDEADAEIRAVIATSSIDNAIITATSL